MTTCYQKVNQANADYGKDCIDRKGRQTTDEWRYPADPRWKEELATCVLMVPNFTHTGYSPEELIHGKPRTSTYFRNKFVDRPKVLAALQKGGHFHIDIDAVRRGDATKNAFGDKPRPKFTPFLHRPMLIDAPTAVSWFQHDLADSYGATVDISRIFSMQKDETILYPAEFDKIRALLGNLAYAQGRADLQKKDAQKKDAVLSQSEDDDR
ncbi:MAG: hypothetical protein GY822_25595, partial [Deltaproteobacteria bacterium]|nr:hypothetical protein [Deltaproteobacteria bacterium]